MNYFGQPNYVVYNKDVHLAGMDLTSIRNHHLIGICTGLPCMDRLSCENVFSRLICLAGKSRKNIFVASRIARFESILIRELTCLLGTSFDT